MKSINQYFSLLNEKISSIDDYINEKLKLADVKTESFPDASLEYWKDELGFDPTEIDYSQNESANKIINKFKSNNKLTELFDYLVSGLTSKMSKDEWINYVSYTDIKDYESYNGKIDEKLKLADIKMDYDDKYKDFKLILINELSKCTIKELEDIYNAGLDYKGILDALFTHPEYLEKLSKDLINIFEKYLNNTLDHSIKNEIENFIDDTVKKYLNK